MKGKRANILTPMEANLIWMIAQILNRVPIIKVKTSGVITTITVITKLDKIIGIPWTPKDHLYNLSNRLIFKINWIIRVNNPIKDKIIRRKHQYMTSKISMVKVLATNSMTSHQIIIIDSNLVLKWMEERAIIEIGSIWVQVKIITKKANKIYNNTTQMMWKLKG